MDAVDLKIFACDIIQNVGILLKMPQIAIATAQMLLHRVYKKAEYTHDKYPIDITAMASIFLAAKIEEYPRKAHEVIDVFLYVISIKLQREISLSNSEYEKVREELILAERRLLKNLGFNLLSSYPHKVILTTYQAMVNALDANQNVWKDRDNQKLLQIAVNYCNDSLRTDVFLEYSKEAVACACIQMACNDYQMFFPKSTDGKEWYLLFAKEFEVEAATTVIQNLYNRESSNLHDVKRYLYLTKIHHR